MTARAAGRAAGCGCELGRARWHLERAVAGLEEACLSWGVWADSVRKPAERRLGVSVAEGPGQPGICGRVRVRPHPHREARGRVGKVASRDRELPQEEWEVLITGHHPSYLDRDAWQGIQARLRADFKPPRGDGGGAARQGAALLSGLIRCGKCGRMMQVGCSGHGPGLSPRYVCGRGTQLYGTPPCQSIGGAYLHRAVQGQLFQVLGPASLQATGRAMADAEQRHRDQVAAFELALERARFEADRAIRKLDEVEPGNRLVARTLEARLGERLAAVERAEAGLAAARARHPVPLTRQELARLTRPAPASAPCPTPRRPPTASASS